MILGHSIDGTPIHIDLDRLVEGRLMAQANSGAGKSWLLRRLLEQTFGKIQHIVIDVEDEFHTLREKHDYILAGRDGGDCPADSRSAELLGRRLLELGMSAVVSIYEMKPDERAEFVRRFLESIVSAPRSLWHPALIVIDEAHMFAPEGAKSESTSAVVDLMARGRKRGFTGVLATQRISKINKDAVAEVNNKLIGRSALDVDMKRAADELGFGKEMWPKLRNMPAGSFFAFGPALSSVVVEMQAGPVLTTHPKAGQRSAPPTPPPSRVRAVLAQLANLPQEAEQEAKSLEEAQKRIRVLERDLRLAQTGKTDPAELKRAIAAAETRVRDQVGREMLTRLQQSQKEVAAVERDLAHASQRLTGLQQLLTPKGGLIPPAEPEISPPPPPIRAAAPSNLQPSAASSELGKCERAILQVLFQFPEGCDKHKIGLLAGYRVSGGFRNALSTLRTLGYIDGSNTSTMRITDAGLDQGPFEPLPEGADLLDYWLRHPSFGKCERAILRALQNNPAGLTKTEIARTSGYEASGGFRNALSTLRTAGVIVGRNTGVMKLHQNLLN